MAFAKSRPTQAIFARVKNMDSQRRTKMTDTVWSVNILIGIGLLGTIWTIYYILKEAYRE